YASLNLQRIVRYDFHDELRAGNDSADGVHIQLLDNSSDRGPQFSKPLARVGLGFVVPPLRGTLLGAIEAFPLLAPERSNGGVDIAPLLDDACLELVSSTSLGRKLVLRLNRDPFLFQIIMSRHIATFDEFLIVVCLSTGNWGGLLELCNLFSRGFQLRLSLLQLCLKS